MNGRRTDEDEITTGILKWRHFALTCWKIIFYKNEKSEFNRKRKE